MLVKFRVNLGTNDAIVCGLDHNQCHDGLEVEVSDEAGQWLITKGIVEPVVEIKGLSKAAAMEGVPPETPKQKFKGKHVAV